MNLPNKITISRIVMTLVFVALASMPIDIHERIDVAKGFHLWFWRAGYIVAVIAGFTDFFDGYIARKYNQVTDFGKLMDPLGDKIHTMASFVVLTWYGIVPGWITILIVAREFGVTGLRTLAAKHGEVIAAKDIGKVKTMLQMLALAFGGCFWIDWLSKDGYTFTYVWPAIQIGVVALTIYSGFDYFWKSRHLYLRDV